MKFKRYFSTYHHVPNIQFYDALFLKSYIKFSDNQKGNK